MRKSKQHIVLFVFALFGLFSAILGHSGAQVYTEGRDVWNITYAPGADILSSSLSVADRGGPTNHDTTYRVMIGIASTSSDSVIYMHVTSVAFGNSQDFSINSGNALVAGQAANFEFNASDAFTYNFRVGTTTKIGLMQVDRKVN